jgi:hypothetical protein
VQDEWCIALVKYVSPNNNELIFDFYQDINVNKGGDYKHRKTLKLNYIKPNISELSEVIRELAGSGSTSSFDLDRYFPELADHVFYQFSQER